MSQSSTLNLENFAHITHPTDLDDKEEIAKRSEALTAIKSEIQNLNNMLEAYVLDLATFDSKARILTQREYQVKEAEYDVAQKEQKVYTLEGDLKTQKEYIVTANKDLKEREGKLVANKNYLHEIEIAKQEYEDRRADAIRQERILDEKTKSIEVVNKRQQELDEKEAVLERASQVDAERKRLLDLREERIKTKERQLLLDRQE